eukprot:SAG31_NODE_3264_length_4481_cov_17.400218_4_plen_220_part_00
MDEAGWLADLAAGLFLVGLTALLEQQDIDRRAPQARATVPERRSTGGGRAAPGKGAAGAAVGTAPVSLNRPFLGGGGGGGVAGPSQRRSQLEFREPSVAAARHPGALHLSYGRVGVAKFSRYVRTSVPVAQAPGTGRDNTKPPPCAMAPHAPWPCGTLYCCRSKFRILNLVPAATGRILRVLRSTKFRKAVQAGTAVGTQWYRVRALNLVRPYLLLNLV